MVIIFFKLAGVALLAVVGFLAGQAKAQQIAAQMFFWKELDKFLGQTEELIRYRSLPLSRVFFQLQTQKDYPHLHLNQQKSFQQFVFPDFVSSQERLQFVEFFRTIGQSTGESMCQQMQYYMVQCKHNWQQLEHEYVAAAKLYPKSYLCLGLLVGLFLL